MNGLGEGCGVVTVSTNKITPITTENGAASILQISWFDLWRFRCMLTLSVNRL